jgi:hypothetical protein
MKCNNSSNHNHQRAKSQIYDYNSAEQSNDRYYYSLAEEASKAYTHLQNKNSNEGVNKMEKHYRRNTIDREIQTPQN